VENCVDHAGTFLANVRKLYVHVIVILITIGLLCVGCTSFLENNVNGYASNESFQFGRCRNGLHKRKDYGAGR